LFDFVESVITLNTELFVKAVGVLRIGDIPWLRSGDLDDLVVIVVSVGFTIGGEESALLNWANSWISVDEEVVKS